MSGEAQAGCGSTGCIIAPARVGIGTCSCLDDLAPEVRVALRSVIKSAGNLLAVIHGDGGHHLDAVGWVQACKDAEEAWLARGVQGPDGPVSEHLRKRVAEVCQAALDGKAGCVGVACIAPHQAGDLLDAYDDARRELIATRERAEAAKRQAAEAVLRAEADGRVVVKMGVRNREMMAERDDARRALIRSCFGSAEYADIRKPGDPRGIRARTHQEVAEYWGWTGLYPEGSPTTGATEGETLDEHVERLIADLPHNRASTGGEQP